MIPDRLLCTKTYYVLLHQSGPSYRRGEKKWLARNNTKGKGNSTVVNIIQMHRNKEYKHYGWSPVAFNTWDYGGTAGDYGGRQKRLVWDIFPHFGGRFWTTWHMVQSFKFLWYVWRKKRIWFLPATTEVGKISPPRCEKGSFLFWRVVCRFPAVQWLGVGNQYMKLGPIS